MLQKEYLLSTFGPPVFYISESISSFQNRKSPNHKDSGSWHLSIILFLGTVTPLNNIEHAFFDVKSFLFLSKISKQFLSCMIAILNRVAHLLMQMFPGIGGMTPTSCAGFVWTQTLLAALRSDIARHCL